MRECSDGGLNYLSAPLIEHWAYTNTKANKLRQHESVNAFSTKCLSKIK